MPTRLLVTATLCLSTLLAIAGQARADQRRDWAVAVQPAGTFATLDLVFPGYQAGIEHRIPIYGIANQLTLRVSSLLPLRFHDGQVDADLRLLVLTLGVSVGWHHDFRLLAFEAGESTSRQARIDREDADRWTSGDWAFFEGRAVLTLPFNQHLLFHNVNLLRLEDRPARSYDWRHGIMRDGRFYRGDFHLFLKHRDWGAIGPMLQVMVYTLSSVQHTQLNYGFALVSRVGLLRRNDLAFLQVLYHFGGWSSPYDNRDSYGGFGLLGPLTFIAAYRAMIDL